MGSVLARQFSTSTSRGALVKTPIPVYGIEGRYSAALFSAAEKKKALDTVEGDLKKLQGAMKSDATFAQFLLDPTVKTKLKVDGLTGASQKLGFNDLTRNLLFALAENNRVSYLDAVVLSEGEKEVSGEVVEAQLLAGAGKTVHLQLGLDGGVQQELGESGVGLHGALQLFQISLDSVQVLLLLGGREECGAVSALPC